MWIFQCHNNVMFHICMILILTDIEILSTFSNTLELSLHILKVVFVSKIRSQKKKIFMILILEILSVVSYDRKNIIFQEKNLKLTKNNTFNFFVIEFFLNIPF